MMKNIIRFCLLIMVVSCSKDSSIDTDNIPAPSRDNNDTVLFAPVVDTTNKPPVADFKSDRSGYYPKSDIKLTSTALDPRNGIIEYRWEIDNDTFFVAYIVPMSLI